jgi:hypothetical protein
MLFLLSKLQNYNTPGRPTTEGAFNRKKGLSIFFIRKIPHYDFFTVYNQILILNNNLKRLMQLYSVGFILLLSNLYINFDLIQVIIYPVFGPVN